MKKSALFKGIITELENGNFFSNVSVKFKNMEIRAVIPRSMVNEWGLRVNDKVYVLIEGKDIFLFKR